MDVIILFMEQMVIKLVLTFSNFHREILRNVGGATLSKDRMEKMILKLLLTLSCVTIILRRVILKEILILRD